MDALDQLRRTLTVVLTVGSSAATASGAISDTATVTALSETDSNSANDTASAATSVLGVPDVIFVDGFESGNTSSWSVAAQ